MRGDIKEVIASTPQGAIFACHITYPETRSYDILKVINEEGEDV